MENIETTAQTITNKLLKNEVFYKHSNLIICGENSDGKSTLINKIVNNCLDKSLEVYYIDPENRKICDPNELAVTKPLEDMSLIKIVKTRLSPANYLKKDVFEGTSSGPAVAYSTIKKSPEKYNELFWDYFGITIKDEEENPNGIGMPLILVNDTTEISDVSSSEAAIMRLLLEIHFAIESKDAKIIVIDEFDEYLTEKKAFHFLSTLQKKYENVVFIVSIQSISIVMYLSDFDIALIRRVPEKTVENNLVRFVDSNNLNEIGQIEKIRDFFGRKDEDYILEEMVSRIVDTGIVNDDDKKFLNGINRQELSGRERILYDYVLRRFNRECEIAK